MGLLSYQFSTITALRNIELVEEDRFAEVGPGTWFFMKLAHKIIPLGPDRSEAEAIVNAIRSLANDGTTPNSGGTDGTA